MLCSVDLPEVTLELWLEGPYVPPVGAAMYIYDEVFVVESIHVFTNTTEDARIRHKKDGYTMVVFEPHFDADQATLMDQGWQEGPVE